MNFPTGLAHRRSRVRRRHVRTPGRGPAAGRRPPGAAGKALPGPGGEPSDGELELRPPLQIRDRGPEVDHPIGLDDSEVHHWAEWPIRATVTVSRGRDVRLPTQFPGGDAPGPVTVTIRVPDRPRVARRGSPGPGDAGFPGRTRRKFRDAARPPGRPRPSGELDRNLTCLIQFTVPNTEVPIQ
eukprot:748069-Hanusia_phi.AAC.2